MSDDVDTVKPGNTNDLPEWAREAISTANGEAAKFRVERNAARDELTKVQADLASLQEKHKEATSKVAEAETAFLKYTVAVESGVPGEKAAEFAALLQGSTKDEVAAHATQLKTLFNTPTMAGQKAIDPSQGQGGAGATAGLSEGGAFLYGALKSNVR